MYIKKSRLFLFLSILIADFTILAQPNDNSIQFKKVKVANLVFDCRIAGDVKDELVVLLHGFPETSVMWTALMKDLSKSGYYCVTPNLRGYSSGARPKGKRQYQIEKLSQDVIDIAAFFGKSKFHLIGHDWGSGIGWKCVFDHPDKILSWTGMSVPHLLAFGDAIKNNKEQGKMSSYIKAFNLPFLPEFIIRRKDFSTLKETLQNCPQAEVEEYLQVLKEPYALTAAINFYRGNYKLLKEYDDTSQLGNISTPTLFIWGLNDAYVGSYAVEKNHQFMKGPYQFLELEAGHWLIQSEYEVIKKAILQHLEKFSLR